DALWHFCVRITYPHVRSCVWAVSVAEHHSDPPGTTARATGVRKPLESQRPQSVAKQRDLRRGKAQAQRHQKSPRRGRGERQRSAKADTAPHRDNHRNILEVRRPLAKGTRTLTVITGDSQCTGTRAGADDERGGVVDRLQVTQRRVQNAHSRIRVISPKFAPLAQLP